MTKDETLKLALDALEDFIPYLPLKDEAQCNRYDKAITALRLAIDVESMASKSTYKEQLETKDEPVSDKLERLLWEFIDLKAMHPNHNPDPRTWPHVFAYAPKPNHLVAWGMEKDGVILDVICPAEHEREEGEYTTPLYTTPQIKTKDEPVAWMYWQSCLNDDGTQTSPWVQRYSKFKPTESVINKDITPLYTTPQQRKPLTDDRIDTILIDLMRQHKSGAMTIARAIEAAHGIKE